MMLSTVWESYMSAKMVGLMADNGNESFVSQDYLLSENYDKLASSYHLDVNKEPGAEQKFKEISNAYKVLSDDEKRSLYDRCGEAGLKGAGVKPGTKPSKCTTCGGQGQAVSSARTPFGVFQQVMTSSSCNGTGEVFTPCNTCSGDGRVSRTKRST
ncbi:hypothetical protein Pint_30794 [Pistacia integerrima]|uniref:Uncharacterized protein n=1 Tax=Pistacia integerrima TaxID=434235 RepID=A0ACC0WZW6_9ROSI|nr:hypothetical protein Pint_30794 [Pistacia integerrima]